MSMQLRPYQSGIVKGIWEAFQNYKTAPLAVAPTGAGKTVIFSFIAAGAAAKGLRTVIVCHRFRLIKQACKALTAFGITYSIIHPDAKPNYNALVQVASVQTLANRVEELAENGIFPRFLVYDEAHHGTAGMWKKISTAWPAPKTLTIGVTATPIRTDGQGLGAQHQGGLFDTLVMGPQISELIEGNFLVPCEVYAPARMLDLATVHLQSNGDFNTRELEERVDKSSITGDVITSYQKYGGNLPAVAFCVSVKHSEHVAEQFRAAGIPAEAVYGDLHEKEQERRLRGLENGSINVITSCDLISEGFDIPAVSVCIMLRPTVSLGMYIQQVGRALRLDGPAKKKAILLDHVGNVLRHGMPDENREWSLDGLIKEKKRKKGEVAPPPRVNECPECFAVHAPAPACIRCGFAYPLPEVEPEPAPMEGELKQVTEEIRLAMMGAKEREIAEARTLEELQYIATIRSYPPGWASHTWKMREKIRHAELPLV